MLARKVLNVFGVSIAVILSWCLFNYQVMETLWVHGFDDGTYSHAYLVPFIILYLIYDGARDGRFHFRKSLSWPLLFVGGCVGSIYWVAILSQISLFYWASSLLILIVLTFQVFKFSWSLVFPLAYLILIYPFWGAFAPLFQDLSVYVVTLIMSFTDIPVYVENEFVTIPSGIFEIARGCSGLRYIIVSMAISSLYVYLYLKTLRSAALFVCFAILGALVTNWIRIVCLILIGHYTNMESSLMTDHNNFGWYIYIPVVLLQFYIGARLESSEEHLQGSLGSIDKTPTNKAGNHLSKSALCAALVLAIFFSSATAHMYVEKANPNKKIKTQDCQKLPSEITLSVDNFSSVCAHSVKNRDDWAFTFEFRGNALDDKASYYLNTVLPIEHFLISKRVKSDHILLISRDRTGAKWKTTYHYEVDGRKYNDLKAFKFARLRSAIKGETKHWLHVSATKCERNCSNISLDVSDE